MIGIIKKGQLKFLQIIIYKKKERFLSKENTSLLKLFSQCAIMCAKDE